MYERMKDLKLKGLEYSDGIYRLFNQRFVFFPPQIIDLLSSIYGEGVKPLLIWLGKKMGRVLIEIWEENLKPKTLEDLTDIFCEMFSNMGWGKIEPHEITEEVIILKLYNNISSYMENNFKYICYFISGILSGFGEFALYRASVSEIECMIIDMEKRCCIFKIEKKRI